MNSMLAGHTTELSSLINDQARPLIERYGETGRIAADRITRAAEASSQQLKENSDGLSSNVEAMVSRLSRSHEEFANLVNQAAANLYSADRNLSATAEHVSETASRSTASMSESTAQIARHIDTLDNSAGNSLETVRRLVSEIESHAGILDKASGLIEAAQSNLSSTLSERQETLASLSEGIARRSQEIDKGLQATAAMVASSVENASRDTQAMSRRLSEEMAASMNEASRLVDESGRSSEEAAHKIRETLRSSVDEAAQRFSGATQEVERIASEIRTILDGTRADVKRGIHAMPEEARESAAAMRQAVEDQVRALNDISSLINTSKSQLSPPARTEQAERKEPAKPQTRQTVSNASQRPFVSPSAGSLAAPREETAARGPSLRGTSGRATTAPSEPSVRKAAPQSSQTMASQSSGGEGWISDLLKAASREEAEPRTGPAKAQESWAAASKPRKPNQVVESLNSLSVDIARAIDHDASVELWGRYQQGERDIFTRRLYTLKGQRTFDEIKAKYETDREFKTAVDRYIADFEKLLSDVMRNNRDRSMVQSYLTSDTGKVYTMLAHAAGKLR